MNLTEIELNDRIRFIPLCQDNWTQCVLITLDNYVIGQERVIRTGNLFEPDNYYYIRFDLASVKESEVEKIGKVFHISEYDDPESGECVEGYAPYWNTVDGLVKALTLEEFEVIKSDPSNFEGATKETIEKEI